jgi:hypothetical protein
MDGQEHFKSMTLELTALKNRVENFIGSAHWQTVGEWKESVLRAVLRRHLPKSIGIGRGFVVSRSGPSTQIDVLLYDVNSPILYRDGDLVLVTPDAVRAVIEVKTSLQPSRVDEAFEKLAAIAESVRAHASRTERFFGLFVYETGDLSAHTAALALQRVAQGRKERIVNCVSIGNREFVRYWAFHPEDRIFPLFAWREYDLPETAPAYFINNVIEFLCSDSVGYNNALWFPAEGKEPHRTGDVPLYSG